MGYPLSGRGRVRAEAPGVSSPAFIVRLRRLWAGRFLLAFLAILGSSPVLAQMQVYYVHSDHLNTPRRVTDEHNTVLWKNPPLSEPFGLMPPEEDPDGDGRRFIFNLRFPGQCFDTESSTHYNLFRDYDLLSGRYLQSDPIGLDGGINTYAYVEGNPLSYIDPQGLAINCRLIGNVYICQSVPLPLGSSTGNSYIDEALRGGKGSSSGSSSNNNGIFHQTCPPLPPEDPCDKKLDEKLLRRLGINAHKIKNDLLGGRGWGAYNLCGCKDGRIVLKRSSNRSLPLS